MKKLFVFAMLFAICSTLFAQDAPKQAPLEIPDAQNKSANSKESPQNQTSLTGQDPERQAQIEMALKGIKGENANVRGIAILTLGHLGAKKYVKDIAEFLKDENALVRGSAVWALGMSGAKEYVKDIARLLKDEDAGVRGNAIDALGQLGAKEYADEIEKLISDSSECDTYDEEKKEWRKTTVSVEAERVLKNWGVDVERIKRENKK